MQHRSYVKDPRTGRVVRCADADEYARLRFDGWDPATARDHQHFIAARMASSRKRLEAAHA